MLTTHFFRIAFQHTDVFSHQHGEKMMTRIPTVLFFVEAEQRKIDYPKKIEPIGRNNQLALRLQKIRAVKADASQNFARSEPLVGCEQNQIALFNRELLC